MPIECHRDGPWALPEGWVWARAGDVLPLEYGKGLPERLRDTSGEIPVYGSAGIVGTHSKSLIEGPCLVMARKGSIGAIYEETRPSWPIDTVYYARESAALHRRFAYWFFSFWRLDRLDQSTAVPSLSRDNYNEVFIPIPPLAEQGRIVARIDELFTEIADGEAALARARDDLDTWRRALLKAAVTGELTREWRETHRPNESGDELLHRIRTKREDLAGRKRSQARRASRRIDTLEQLRFEIPETWSWAEWSDVGVSQNGRPFPSRDYADEGIKLLRPGNLYADGRVRWTSENTRYLPADYLDQNSDLLIQGKEIVINLTAQSLRDEFLGRVCLTEPNEHCLLNQRLARLTPVEILPEFMLIVFKSPLFRSFVRHLNSGSLIQHMFTSQIENFAFPLPPIVEQQAIVEAVRAMFDAANELAEDGAFYAKDVTTLRQSTLKAAFEGRLVAQDPRDEPAERLLARLAGPGETAAPPRRRPAARRVARAAE